MTRETNVGGLAGAPRWIVICMGVYFAVDLFVLYVWKVSAQVFTIQGPSDSTSGLSVVAMAGVGLYLSMVALRGFQSGTALRPAWMLITLAAAAQALSGISAQVLESAGRFAAQIVGGPVRLALLAAALPMVLRALRKFGFLVRPSAADWAVFGVVCLFAVCRFAEGGVSDWTSLAGLPVLCVLLLEAMLLRRSVLRMGSGPIARCWAAFAYGIFLTVLAEMALWVIPHYSQALPPAIIGSLLRFPTTAVFALGPAYQLMAQRRATEPAVDLRRNLATGIQALAR